MNGWYRFATPIHRALHNDGDEQQWWIKQKLDPIKEAEILWHNTKGQTLRATKTN